MTQVSVIFSDCKQGKKHQKPTATVVFRGESGQPYVPKGFHEISKIEDATVQEAWLKAAAEEHAKSEANGCFEWISDEKVAELRAAGVPILRHTWVFKLKRDDNGEYTIFKARGCVDGSQQKHGIDYAETFAPTAREDTFKLFMALATLMNWDLRQLDVRSAFTNAMLNENVYMWAPKGVDTPTRVCKLLRALYGLKQSPRSWNSDFSKKLIENGFERCALDACLFRKYISAEQGWVYLICYVDDIIVGGGTEAVQTTAELLKTLWDMDDFGRPKDYLGFEIEYVRVGEAGNDKAFCLLHQTRYIGELVKRFGMESCKKISSPCEPGSVLQKSDQATVENEIDSVDFPYREFCGAMIYLRTRPDVTYCVNKLCKWMQSPGPKMVTAAKRLLRYLSCHKRAGISFGINRAKCLDEANQKKMDELFNANAMYGMTDSSFCDNTDTGQSTMGDVIMLAGGPVSHSSYEYKAKLGDTEIQCDGSIMRSTVEAEYVALSGGANDLIALKELTSFFAGSVNGTVNYGQDKPISVSVAEQSEIANSGEFMKQPMAIFGDNQGSIRCVTHRTGTKLAKHIRIKPHLIRDLYEFKTIEPFFLGTKDQLADVMTKGLFGGEHSRLCSQLMYFPEEEYVQQQGGDTSSMHED